MDCVVGSGPAGAACAAALLQRGQAVHLLDAGLRLEPERARVVARLAQSPPERWDATDRAWLAGGMKPGAKGIPEKLLFGSDYPYREAGTELGIAASGVGLRPSLALGGLSTVWGAAMMPYLTRDMTQWPVTAEQLAPHYRAALELTGLSAAPDDLSELFPLHMDAPGQLQCSRQAQALWQVLERHRDQLRAAGFRHGRARLAVKPDCVHCGTCLSGCPYGYIYNSADTIGRLPRLGQFSYQPDVVVSAVRETAGEVIVSGHNRATREPFEFRAQRVFLAAGVLATTGILLRSLSAHDRPVRMKDSQYFLLPLALWRHVPRVRQERLHALSQVFLELADAELSPHTIHLQLYSFNPLIGMAIRKSLGPLAGPLDCFARELENRLLLLQGFLHSAHSSEIAVTLRRDAERGRDQLRLDPVINPAAEKLVRGIVRKLWRNSFELGALPLPPLLQIAEPGRSFHAGGTFPMRAQPGAFETDLLGRPAGWRRIHAVDATVFPSIPATTITLTVMANAHRIASQAAAPEP